MLKSNLIISTLIATTIFTSSHTLFAGGGEENETSTATSSTAPKLSIEDQLSLEYVAFSRELMEWNHGQKEKTETNVPIAVPGLEAETREQAALRILLSMADSDMHTPLHRALINRNSALAGLFLATLGKEANSLRLLTQNNKSLLWLVLDSAQSSQPSEDDAFEILIALRESAYKFDDKEHPRFQLFSNYSAKECGTLTFTRFQERYQINVALAILLGADKSFVTTDLNHISSRGYDSKKRLQAALAKHYKDLCEKGLGHLIDISEVVENGMIAAEKIYPDQLQKKSAEVRQKKSQMQQLSEALERVSKK